MEDNARFTEERVPGHDSEGESLDLIAYRVGARIPMEIVPAGQAREWMNQTSAKFANRCLPLLMANQSGWFILNSHRFRATWDGSGDVGGVTIEVLSGDPPFPVTSHFGHGILTWTLPYLFRTPPGYNILARGPSNLPKDGVSALEGLVETDWSVATFTMNWQLTRPDHRVTFEVGEPICMIVPQRRGELESFAPAVRDVSKDPELARYYAMWCESRSRHNLELAIPGSKAAVEGWEKDYFRGLRPDGSEAPAHQSKLNLRIFG